MISSLYAQDMYFPLGLMYDSHLTGQVVLNFPLKVICLELEVWDLTTVVRLKLCLHTNCFGLMVFWKVCKMQRSVAWAIKLQHWSFLGILIPFIVLPEKLRNLYIDVKVNKIACIFGWINRHVKEDLMASILVRCLQMICMFLGSQVQVQACCIDM